MVRFAKQDKKGQDSPYRGAIIAIAVMIGVLLLGYGGSQLIRRSTHEEPRVHRESAEIHEYEEPELAPEPELSPEEKASLADPSSLHHVYDSNIVGSNQAFYHLLYSMKTASEAELARLAEQAVPAPSSDELQEDPLDPGTPVHLAGDVVRIRFPLSRLEIPKANIKTIEYEVRDDDGNRYSVYAVGPVSGIEEGDPIRVVGRYLRPISEGIVFSGPDGRLTRQLTLDLLGEAKEIFKPIIITRRPDPTPLLERDDILDRVKDDELGHAAKPLYYLVHKVQNMSDEEIERLAEENRGLTLDQIDDAPADARGKFVPFEGVLIATQRQRKQANIAEVDALHWSAVRGRGGHRVWVYTLERPAGLARHDTVRVHGVFFKRRYYEDQRGYELPALLFVARRMERVERVVQTPNIGALVLVLGGLVAIGMTIAVVLERRSSLGAADHAHRLAARRRPANLNEAARQVAARKQAREQPERPDPPDSSDSPDRK